MDRAALERLLREVAAGTTGVAEALERIAGLATADIGVARIDHHREVRRGIPEAVLGEGKSPEQIFAIVDHLVSRRRVVLVTRLDADSGRRLQERHPRGRYDPVSRTFLLRPGRGGRGKPGLLVVSAGTADLPVAEEVAVSAVAMGLRPERLYDVGVAGVHRLLENADVLRRARVIVAVAGMEGALPGVIAGLVAAPVIGVPTSVGYGVSRGGLAALLTMLGSCSGGVTVVNIDNGYGAACAARAILDAGAKTR
ncbi:MAG: nickel pincer cofactor biosynthesis protein LarB [Acidobacteria bacterium]|nr:MAG: nickel pincer cofactor biosynthesis protein LarB [Acidobacteriota bacterium]